MLKLYEGVNISEGEYYKQNEARHITEHVSFKQVIRKGKGNIRRRKTRINFFFLTFSMINGKSNSEMGTKRKNVTKKKVQR